MAQVTLGKVCVVPKGEHNANVAYEKLDIVSSSGSSYLAKKDVTAGIAISNEEYWLPIASKGDPAPASMVESTVQSYLESVTVNSPQLLYASTYDSGSTYNLDDLVIHSSKIYYCTTSIPSSEAWNSSHWQEIKAASMIDETLTWSGAAADAKIVGDKALLFRGELTSGQDVWGITKPGVYIKGAGVSLTNGINKHLARILAIRSPTYANARIFLWFDLYDNTVYVSSLATTSDSWNGWTKLIDENVFFTNSFLGRDDNLTAGNGDFRNNLNGPGIYYKENNVTLTGGVNNHAARIIYIVDTITAHSPFGKVVVWIDTSSQDIYISNYYNSAWSSWKQLMNEKNFKYSITGRTEMGDMNRQHGHCGATVEISQTRSKMAYELLPGANYRIVIDENDAVGISDSSVLYYKDNNVVGNENSNDNYSKQIYSTCTNFSAGNILDGVMPADCKYIKIFINNSNATTEHHERFTIYSDSPIFEVPNMNIVSTASSATTTIGNNESPETFRGQTFHTLSFVYNIAPGIRTSGRMILPPNYDIHGEPIPLIVFIHGSGGMINRTYQLGKFSSGSYIPYLNYLSKEGFAVFDCYPWGFESNLSDDTYSPLCIPLHQQAYLQGIRYVCSRYNIDINQVSILCKSQGGYLGFWAISQLQFPFKAVCMFAPYGVTNGGNMYLNSAQRTAITKYINFDFIDNYTTQDFIAGGNEGGNGNKFTHRSKMLALTTLSAVNGVTNPNCYAQVFPSTSPVSSGYYEKQNDTYILTSDTTPIENKEYYRKFDTPADAIYYAATTYNTQNNVKVAPNWMLDSVPAHQSDLLNTTLTDGPLPEPVQETSNISRISTFKDLVKISRCPTKIWTAIDDSAVSAYEVYAVYKWILNGGGDAEFECMPIGHGGHHAMDTNSNAQLWGTYDSVTGKTKAVTALGEEVYNIPLAYHEAVDFIRRKSGNLLEA